MDITKVHARIVLVILPSLIFSACAKQPSEVDKAEISKEILSCLTSVTTKVGGKEQGLFDAIGEITTSLSDMDLPSAKKEWELMSGGNITLTIKTDKTKYECEYAKSEDSNWGLIKVRRNSEEVFDSVKNAENIRANEAARLAKEKAEQEAYVSTWHEKSYRDASYKYYEKPHEGAESGSYNSPSLIVSCNPKGTEFRYGGSLMSERVVEVSFDGSPIENVQLTDFGSIGIKEKVGYMTMVLSDKAQEKRFLQKLFASKELTIDGIKFKTGNLNEVPCR